MSDTPVSPYQSCSASIYILVRGLAGKVLFKCPIPISRLYRPYQFGGPFFIDCGASKALFRAKSASAGEVCCRLKDGTWYRYRYRYRYQGTGTINYILLKLIVVKYAADYGCCRELLQSSAWCVANTLRTRVVLLPRGLAHEAVHVVHGTPWSCIAFRTSHRATSRCTSRI